MKRIKNCSHYLLLVTLSVFLAGCISSGPKPQEKWESTRRAEAHVDLGMDYLRRGEHETARDEFEIALSIDSSSSRANHAMGLIEANLGQTEDALKRFARAVSLDRLNFVAINDYGIHLCQNEQVDKGLVQLESIVEDRDNHQIIATHLGLAICHHRANRLEQAKSFYRQSLAGSPRLPQALYPMAEISNAERKPLLARAFLERYFAAGALSAKALFLAVQVELELKDIERARLYARELRGQFPKAEEVPRLKALL